ncbi:MAG: pyrimidine 5'-nucleotidase [Hyphomicrobiales bacterium]|nr:MAG: pyrimidine 5'-nucleotidase [Hyphomicrobiales bacterium]
MAEFARVSDWVFDLDNTLYPHHSNLFDQIDKRMTTYVAQLMQLERVEARKIQKDYYHRYGTTLRGLMLEHEIDTDAFLEFVHDIDHTPIEPDPALAAAIKALPGRKYIYTNGSRKHAENVAARLGIIDHFEDIFDIVAADLEPKPNPGPYHKFFSDTGIDPKNGAMFEDLVKNLRVPKQNGMLTTLIVPLGARDVLHEEWELEKRKDDPVDYVTDDLTLFLQEILAAIATA